MSARPTHDDPESNGCEPIVDPRIDIGWVADLERKQAKRALGGLVLCAVSLVISVVFDVLQLRLASAMLRGDPIDDSTVTANDIRMGVMGAVEATSYLLTAVSMLVWLRQAYLHARDLERIRVAYTPGQAWGSFLIPVMNLLRPYRVMRHLYLVSDPTSLAVPSNRSDTSSGTSTRAREAYAPFWGRAAPFELWWALWLGGNFLARSTFAGLDGAPDKLYRASIGSIASDVVSAGAAVAAFLVVRAIHERRQERFRRHLLWQQESLDDEVGSLDAAAALRHGPYAGEDGWREPST